MGRVKSSAAHAGCIAAIAATSLIAATLVTTPGGAADLRGAMPATPVVEQFSYSPVAMPPLPVRHQNHCGFVAGHYVCADHCGIDYQVYYCPAGGSGCCHVGYGYCDAGGQLRCTSPFYDLSSLFP